MSFAPTAARLLKSRSCLTNVNNKRYLTFCAWRHRQLQRQQQQQPLRTSAAVVSSTSPATMSSSSLSNVHKKLKSPFVGAFQMLADPLLTEHYAQLGFGAVLIDQQHGLLGKRVTNFPGNMYVPLGLMQNVLIITPLQLSLRPIHIRDNIIATK